MSVCCNNRRLLVGLRQIAQGQPIIMADQGYVCADCPELTTSKSPVLDKCRALIERYFGRMTVVLGAAPKPVPLSYEHFNPCVGALCFPTNVHTLKPPLVNKDAKLRSAMGFMRQTKHDEKIKDTESVRERERSLGFIRAPRFQCWTGLQSKPTYFPLKKVP